MPSRFLIIFACVAITAGCGGYHSNEGATTRTVPDAYTLTISQVGGQRDHVQVDCRRSQRLCRAIEIVLRAPAKQIGICGCPAVTETVRITGTLDGHPFPARQLTACSTCGRGAAYRAAVSRILGAAHFAS